MQFNYEELRNATHSTQIASKGEEFATRLLLA
jgi:hypothetical protein